MIIGKSTLRIANGYKATAAKNSLWYIVARLVELLINFYVITLLARYLGSQGFGVYSYTLACVGIMVPLSTLGVNSILSREIVKGANPYEILGTGILVRVIGVVLILVLALPFIQYFPVGEYDVTSFVLLLMVSEVLKSFSIFSYWFEAENKGRDVAIVRICAVFIGAIVKIILVNNNCELKYIISASVLDGVILALFWSFAFCKQVSSIFKLRISFRLGLNLVKVCFPLLLSSFTAVIYLKLDQLMIGRMMGEVPVGIYAEAARLSEVWYFMPVAIVTAVFPFLIRDRKDDPGQYNKKKQDLFSLLIWMSIVVATLTTLVSSTLIQLFFGDLYNAASDILVIHVWGGVFMSVRALFSKLLIVDDEFMLSLVSHGLGAIVNVLLNLELIPLWGLEGAAIASVISYAFSGLFVFLMFSKTRANAVMCLISFFTPVSWVRKMVQREVKGLV